MPYLAGAKHAAAHPAHDPYDLSHANATAQLEDLLEGLDKRGEKTLSGEQAADLYTTFGMPFEITRDIARER